MEKPLLSVEVSDLRAIDEQAAIDSAPESIVDENQKNKIIREYQNTVRGSLANGEIDDALSIISKAIEAGIATKEDFLTEEITTATVEGVENSLSYSEIDDALSIISKVIEAGIATKEDFHDAIIDAVKNRFSYGRIDNALSAISKAVEAGIATKEDFPAEEITTATVEGVKHPLSQGYIDDVLSTISKTIEAGIATKEDFHDAVIDAVKSQFFKGDTDRAFSIISKTIEAGIATKEDFLTEEITTATVEGVKHPLSYGNIDNTFSTISKAIEAGIATKEDFHDAIIDAVKDRLSYGNIDDALSIVSKAIEAGIATKEDFHDAIIDAVKNRFSNGYIDDALSIVSKVIEAGIATKEDFLAEETTTATVDKVKSDLSYGNIDRALSTISKAIEAGIATKEDFHDAIIDAVKSQFSKGKIDDALSTISEVIEAGIATKEGFHDTIIDAVKSQFSYGHIDNALSTISKATEAGIATKEDFPAEEITTATVEGVKYSLSQGYIDDALSTISKAIEAGIATKEDFSASIKICLQKRFYNVDKVLLFASHSQGLGLTPSDFRSYAVSELKVVLEARDYATLSTLVSNALALGLNESDFLQNKEQSILAKASYLAFRDFGAYVTASGIELYESMLSSKQGDAIPEEVRQFGIEQAGPQGLESLRSRFREETFAFIRHDKIHEGIASTPVFSSFLKKQIRFEGSQWGRHDNDEFLQTLEMVKQNQEAGLTKTHFAYQNAFLDVPTASTETAKVTQEPEAVEGVKTVATAMEGAQFLSTQLRDPVARSAALERMQSTLDASLGNAITNLSSFVNRERERISSSTEMDDRQKQGRLKGLEARQRLIDALNAFRSESINSSIEKIFGDQTNQEASVEALRTLLQPEVLAKGESALDPYRSAVRMLLSTVSVLRLPDTEIPKTDQEGDITRGQANTLLDLTDHVLIQETLGLGKGQEKPLTKEEKELRHAGERILRTPQIKKASEAFERAIQAGTETQSIEVIPSRGALLEFSGHISDACWASKYNIAEDFPNITSLTFILKEKDEQGNPLPPDPAKDKLVGACLLIEADDTQGNPVLIMRGMNPLENTINRLMPKVFVDQLMGYVEGVAKKMGRRVAIVVDEASEASTNRPSIAGVLKPMRDSGKLNRVVIPDIKPGQERPYTGYLDSARALEMSTGGYHPTNFNGYDISQKTYQWKNG